MYDFSEKTLGLSFPALDKVLAGFQKEVQENHWEEAYELISGLGSRRSPEGKYRLAMFLLSAPKLDIPDRYETAEKLLLDILRSASIPLAARLIVTEELHGLYGSMNRPIGSYAMTLMGKRLAGEDFEDDLQKIETKIRCLDLRKLEKDIWDMYRLGYELTTAAKESVSPIGEYLLRAGFDAAVEQKNNQLAGLVANTLADYYKRFRWNKGFPEECTLFRKRAEKYGFPELLC